MSLEPGATVGHYRILSALGAGGMGEVYRALDTRLDRTVAVKVLPDRFSDNPDRMARLAREAKLLASLNHPNIAQVYGVEGLALILELVEGQDLSQRIARGALPIPEALLIAGQVAEALAAAHAAGVIHRDLKPANIKVRDDGTVKVLDFGLAKALALDPHEAAEASTVTSPALTEIGVVLGTAAYMSPEQARGKALDERADVWSFGCVLYEMLAGRRAFDGLGVNDTLANVTSQEPVWAALPPETPVGLRRVLRLCLAKDPDGRFHDIRDVRVQLSGEAGEDDPGETAAGFRPGAPRTRRWITLAAMLGLGAGLAIGVGLTNRSGADAPPVDPPLARIELALGSPFRTTLGTRGLAVSRDGRILAYAGGPPTRQINIRRLDRDDEVPVPGTEGGSHPFFSSDGAWLGFWKDRQLYKVALEGGAPIALCPARTVYGASWVGDRILFGQAHSGIFEVSEAGGEPKLVVAPDPTADEIAVNDPQLLADGNTLIFTLLERGQNWNRASVVLERLDSRDRIVLVEGGHSPFYLQTGHLLFARDQTLFALPLDLRAPPVADAAVPVVEGVRQSDLWSTGTAHYAVSENGVLVYRPSGTRAQRSLVWVDRAGEETPLPLPGQAYIHARLSPDDTAIVVDTLDGQDLWLHDVARGTTSRLTTDQTHLHPVFSADGSRIIFDSDIGLTLDWQRRDESSASELVTLDDLRHLTATSASPDGTLLAVEISDDFAAYDIGVVSLVGDRTVRPLLADPDVREMAPMFSPDGQYLAYVSDRSGRDEVYVHRLDGTGQPTQISQGGGVEPQWSPAGSELFYRSGLFGSSMMVVEVETTPVLAVGPSRELFTAYYHVEGVSRHPVYDVSNDGRRFLMIARPPLVARPGPGLTALVNWFSELERLVPTR